MEGVPPRRGGVGLESCFWGGGSVFPPWFLLSPRRTGKSSACPGGAGFRPPPSLTKCSLHCTLPRGSWPSWAQETQGTALTTEVPGSEEPAAGAGPEGGGCPGSASAPRPRSPDRPLISPSLFLGVTGAPEGALATVLRFHHLTQSADQACQVEWTRPHLQGTLARWGEARGLPGAQLSAQLPWES